MSKSKNAWFPLDDDYVPTNAQFELTLVETTQNTLLQTDIFNLFNTSIPEIGSSTKKSYTN